MWCDTSRQKAFNQKLEVIESTGCWSQCSRASIPKCPISESAGHDVALLRSSLVRPSKSCRAFEKLRPLELWKSVISLTLHSWIRHVRPCAQTVKIVGGGH